MASSMKYLSMKSRMLFRCCSGTHMRFFYSASGNSTSLITLFQLSCQVLVFLIACGAILALKELSESTDSISRYEMLRKIGVEEGDIERSLFVQMGIFFLLPLLLACIHSIFGMRCSSVILESIGTQQVGTSMAATTVIILLIYGGYFLITYFCSKSIIKERK